MRISPSGRPAVYALASTSISSHSPARSQSATVLMSVPSTRFLAIRWSSMQTALSERENAQRTGGSGNRLVPDEGSDHIGYSAEFADSARLGATQHAKPRGNRSSG